MGTTKDIKPLNGEAGVSDRAQKTILVVEDDQTHRTFMEKILKECNFNVVPAENGIIALSKIDTGQHFDLIIMDWDMPELDGLETVKQIRAREINLGQARTPVISFTSNRAPGDREKCLAAGMDAYLPKNVWMPKWRDMLMDSLQGLVASNFDVEDFEGVPVKKNHQDNVDLDAFDLHTLEQSALLLKDDIFIAVEEYLEDAAEYIRNIRDGIERGDAEKAARGSHPLKSNSKGFGLIAVSKIAEAINTKTRQNQMDGVEILFSQLQEAFHRAEKKLRSAIKNLNYTN